MSDVLELIENAEQIDDEEQQTNKPHVDRIPNHSFNFMTNYIQTNKSDIPEELRGTVLVEPDTLLTLAMYWVHSMKTVPVPTWMIHDPNHKDAHGWTIAMHYISVNSSYPPKWMECDPMIQNDNGRTVAMFALLHRSSRYENQDIPSWMKHDINIFDSLGYSLIDYWLSANSEEIPSWMLEKIDDKKHWVNGEGENIAISYLLRRWQDPPEDFVLPPGESFKTKHNNSYEDIQKYVHELKEKQMRQQEETTEQ